jgi:hypothetical protein
MHVKGQTEKMLRPDPKKAQILGEVKDNGCKTGLERIWKAPSSDWQTWSSVQKERGGSGCAQKDVSCQKQRQVDFSQVIYDKTEILKSAGGLVESTMAHAGMWQKM